jgi:hypothetical protein
MEPRHLFLSRRRCLTAALGAAAAMTTIQAVLDGNFRRLLGDSQQPHTQVEKQS